MVMKVFVDCSKTIGMRLLADACMPTSPPTWLNQRRVYITDERGFRCTRDEVDSHTGCCKQGTQHMCGL